MAGLKGCQIRAHPDPVKGLPRTRADAACSLSRRFWPWMHLVWLFQCGVVHLCRGLNVGQMGDDLLIHPGNSRSHVTCFLSEQTASEAVSPVRQHTVGVFPEERCTGWIKVTRKRRAEGPCCLWPSPCHTLRLRWEASYPEGRRLPPAASAKENATGSHRLPGPLRPFEPWHILTAQRGPSLRACPGEVSGEWVFFFFASKQAKFLLKASR